MPKPKPENSEQGTIKQGSVAEFFRKRTQLVGFDFGLHKHTQYAIEFMDNSIDAIESFQWKIGKIHPEYAYLLKDDLILENLSYFTPVSDADVEQLEQQLEDKRVDDEGFELAEDGTIKSGETVNGENQLIIEEENEEEVVVAESSEEDDEEARKLRGLKKKAEELEEEVQKIIQNLEDFIHPIEPLVNREPFVIFKIEEHEAQEVYADISQKSAKAYEYHLQIFDNGTGMSPLDLEKFGKYLASSKSQKLKQTRGSQGFGSPSAFSDAQNTTGKPVTVISKDNHHIFGMCSQFYTTSKNNKEFMVPATEISTPFEHGTYISLNYLNVKYRRGFIDDYIKSTAITNPHVTIIFIDPYGEENVYPRRVDRFPREPTYALPHPISSNIGDFQDKLRVSENLTLSSFFQDNFVRMSPSLAKKILVETERKLERVLNLIALDQCYLSWLKRSGSPIYLARLEKRVYGRSTRQREKLIVYQIEEPSDLLIYWDAIKPYNELFKQLDAYYKKSRKIKEKLLEQATKKGQRTVNRELRENESEIEKIEKQILEIRKNIAKEIKKVKLNPEMEVSGVKIVDSIEDSIKELRISAARPNTLSQRQTEELFKRFKAQKYLAPPSDPAVPIGASVLQTTMLKEYNLNPSHRTDLFLEYDDSLNTLEENDVEYYSGRILAKFKRPPYLDVSFPKNNLYYANSDVDVEQYDDFFQKFDLLHAHDDDFIEGKTRKPTSGKGLAFVVEAVVAISPKIPNANVANQVLKRYVNRTPKLRDNSDCAIWKGVQSVNWKNYKVDTFDNGIPKGNIRILVNISGPYVHLMFKSQSKNALAEDEILLKEIKMCLEAIGRKIRRYKNKRLRREKSQKRSKVIEKFIPIFVSSLMAIAVKNEEFQKVENEDLEIIIKAKLNEEEETFINSQEQIKGKLPFDVVIPTIQPKPPAKKLQARTEQSIQEKEDFSEAVKELHIAEKPKVEPEPVKEKAPTVKIPTKAPVVIPKSPKSSVKKSNSKQLSIQFKKVSDSSATKPSKLVLKDKSAKQKTLEFKKSTPKVTAKKPITYSAIQANQKKKVENLKQGQAKQKKRSLAKPKPAIKEKAPAPEKKLHKPESKITLITSKAILGAIEDEKWYNIKEIIKNLHITDIKDARYLQLKLKQLTREKRVLITLKSGKTYYKRK